MLSKPVFIAGEAGWEAMARRLELVQVLRVDAEGKVAPRPVKDAPCKEVIVKGKGSHAAQPHKAIDPVMTAVRITRTSAASFETTPLFDTWIKPLRGTAVSQFRF